MGIYGLNVQSLLENGLLRNHPSRAFEFVNASFCLLLGISEFLLTWTGSGRFSGAMTVSSLELRSGS